VLTLKVAVLGCGTVGSTAVKTLDASNFFDEITIGDVNVKAAEKVASTCKGNVKTVRVDADKPESLGSVMKGSDVVLNCIGPFYKYGPKILSVAISEGVNYVDVCDDLDATQAQLELSGEAERAGVTALIGMGSSPGLANVIAKFCAESLLDVAESVDILHIHGGEPAEGAAVIKHRIHSMMMDIPVFLNGELVTVKLFEESGMSLEEDVDFPGVGTYKVYPYPHPETITLPRYIKGLRNVTNRGTVLPPKYIELTRELVRLGLTSEEPLEVQGQKIAPLEFAVAFILSQRERLLREAGITEPLGCLKIVVKGERGGETLTYSFAFTSRGQGMGEGTGIPAAIGAILMAQGKVAGEGVLPPEACVNPVDVLSLAQQLIKSTGKGELPLVIDVTGEDGVTRRVDIKELFTA